MSDQTMTPPSDETAVGLDERLFEATIGTLELLSVHLGRRLGLYSNLTGARTAPELAAAAGIDTRYAREWLEQQAVAGLVTTDANVAAWDERPYWLDDEQRAVFLEPEDAAHISPFADMVVGVADVIDEVADAYTTGGGVPFANYGRWLRDGQAAINRPAFTSDLVNDWIGAVPDIVERLRTGGRILDLGSGCGWSTIALARVFPEAGVVGVDSDDASIDEAKANDTDGVATFVAGDAAAALDELGGEPADLVLVLEALHDMAQPAETLAAARRVLADGGAVLVADEKVSPTFVAPGDELERMMYGWSVTHCLPAAMAEEPSAAIGTVIRPAIVESLAAEAGFGSVELSTVDAGFFNLYVLRP